MRALPVVMIKSPVMVIQLPMDMRSASLVMVIYPPAVPQLGVAEGAVAVTVGAA